MVPLPADFTGDGELFMLRVRGESMIDAGILDGDFIVARVERDVGNGDVVVAGIPGEEATVKTFRRKGVHDRARAVQPHDGADGLRSVRGPGLRQGRHGAPQALTDGWPARPGQLACSALFSPSDHVPERGRTSTVPVVELRRNSRSGEPLSSLAFAVVPSGRVTIVPAVT